MMAPERCPFWIALCRRIRACTDPFTWACVAAAGGLVLYMAIGIALAWIGGRL